MLDVAMYVIIPARIEALNEDKKEEEQRIAETEEIDVLKILERLQKQEEEASKKLEEAKDSRNEE